jgi:hypothetical protein
MIVDDCRSELLPKKISPSKGVQLLCLHRKIGVVPAREIGGA